MSSSGASSGSQAVAASQSVECSLCSAALFVIISTVICCWNVVVAHVCWTVLLSMLVGNLLKT